MSMESKLENAEDLRSEDPLAGRLANGNPRAPGELVERHYAELYRYARALLRDAPAAEDAVQDAFERAFVALGKYSLERIEILSFEATRTASVADKAAAVVDLAYRLRIMGSLALSLCHLAAGRVDAVCSLKPRAWHRRQVS